MDLKLCPSCGQSVLDDEAKECPFCGAAMDGSDKGSKKPPSGKPAAGRPTAGSAPAAGGGHRPGASGGGAARPTGAAAGGAAKPGGAGSGSPARPEAKPIQAGARSTKPTVDEDDPFGLGAVNPVANVIQALEKPEKGHLHRVVCPMCEKPGFVAKSAIGKQVRCANVKCMVPIFTVPDPDAPAVDRVPKRRAQADQDGAAASSGAAKPRSPMMVYGIVGVVLLVAAVGLVQFLNTPPSVPQDLNQAVAVPEGGYGGAAAEEEAQRKAEADRKAKAEQEQNPLQDVERYVKRMIQTARQTSNRDKAFARRLTGDVYLRLDQPQLAAQEFSQLLLVNRQAAYYQIEPRLNVYWQKKAAGDAAGAKAEYDQILRDAATIPTSGRMAMETSMGLAAALIVEGRQADAVALIARQRRDRSIILNRDAMSSAAWFFASSSLRSVGRPAFAVTDVFSWQDPLQTAVAADLAARSRWKEAIAWAGANPEKLQAADSLAVVAELAAGGNATDADLASIEAAAAAVHPMAALRVQAVMAAERKSTGRLQASSAVVAGLQPGAPLSLPAIDKVLRMDLPDAFETRMKAAALTEFVRAAVVCGDSAKAEEGLRKLTATMFEIAPPTAETRRAVLEVETRDADVKRRINTELRITSETEVASTFRNYRRKVDQFALVAEERRLSLIQKLARVVRAGGVESVQAVLNDAAAGLRQEVLVDELAGLLAAAATRTGKAIPEVQRLDPALIVPLPERTKELHEIGVGPRMVQAWSQVQQGSMGNAAKVMEVRISELPGLREAVLNELVQYAASVAEKPDTVYAGIGQIANPVWREEALQTAGRAFALRGLEKPAVQWLEAENRMPSTEQVTAFYGLCIGTIERVKPVKP